MSKLSCSGQVRKYNTNIVHGIYDITYNIIIFGPYSLVSLNEMIENNI